jgi:hypothetical protein
MAYTRPPAATRAGVGLKQTPNPSTQALAPVFLDVDIASSSSLGSIKVGSGLSIAPDGTLSTTGGGSCDYNSTLRTGNYTATLTDYYIGFQLTSAATLTLPLNPKNGILYVIKLEYDSVGNKKLTIQPQSPNKIDNKNSITLQEPYQCVSIFSRGSNWYIIGEFK